MSSSNLADRAGRADQADRIISTIACRLSRELDSMKEILGGVVGSEMIDLIRAETSSHLQTIRGLMKDGQILPRANLRLSQEASHLSPYDRPLGSAYSPPLRTRFLSFWPESRSCCGPCNAPATEKQQILHVNTMIVNSLELMDKGEMNGNQSGFVD